MSSLALRARYYSGGALPGGTRGGIERATARQQAGDISSAVARSQPEPTPRAIATQRARFFVLNGFIPQSGQVNALPVNPKRVYLEFSNESFANTMRVMFGGPSSNSLGVRIPPGATRVWDVVCPIDGFYIFGNNPGDAWSLTEGNPT